MKTKHQKSDQKDTGKTADNLKGTEAMVQHENFVHKYDFMKINNEILEGKTHKWQIPTFTKQRGRKAT